MLCRGLLSTQQAAARHLLDVLADLSAFPELRRSAYEGLLAAMDVLPLDRPPVGRLLDLSREIDPEMVSEFKQRYGIA